jgi:hypothetical protein
VEDALRDTVRVAEVELEKDALLEGEDDKDEERE